MKKKIIGIVIGLLIIILGFGMCSSEPTEENTNPYDVKISKEAIVSDWNGDRVLIVEYQWTNNDSVNNTLTSTYNIDAYQDGIELDNEFFIDGDYNFDNCYNEVKPGKTQTFYKPYELNSKSDVSIELYGMWDTEPVVSKTISVK